MNKKGNILRTIRREKKMSANELAEAAGVSQTYISALELGKRKGTRAVWEKIAEIMDNPLLLVMHVDENLDSAREASLLTLAKSIISIAQALDLSWDQIKERSKFELGSGYFRKLKDVVDKKEAGKNPDSMIQIIDEFIADNLIGILGQLADEIQKTKNIGGSCFEKQRMVVPILEQLSDSITEENSKPDYEEYASGYLSISVSDLDRGERKSPFLLRVHGNNMKGVGITQGSLVLVNPNIRQVQDGDTVLIKWKGMVSINGLIFLSDSHVEIRSANQDLHPIKVKKDEIEIIGKVTRVYSDQRPDKIW